MQSTLTVSQLADYVSRQVDHLFPDGKSVAAADYRWAVDLAMDRLAYSFKRVSLKTHFEKGQPQFNHLHSDHYVVFLWLLSNCIWRREGPSSMAGKIYYLNKALHAFDCIYSNELPDVFLIFHSVGTVLGKAKYGDYLVVSQGCTVGAHKGEYPVIGKGVGLAANTAVLGPCSLGDRVSVGAGTTVFCRDVAPDQLVCVGVDGTLVFKKGGVALAQRMYNVDLSKITGVN